MNSKVEQLPSTFDFSFSNVKPLPFNLNCEDISPKFGCPIRTNNNFDLHQIGAAFVFENNNSMWNKFVVSLFYEQLQDYNARFFAAGSTNNSIASYFLENANGLNLENISAFPRFSLENILVKSALSNARTRSM